MKIAFLSLLVLFSVSGCSLKNQDNDSRFYLRFSPEISLEKENYILVYKGLEYKGKTNHRQEIEKNIPFDSTVTNGVLMLKADKDEKYQVYVINIDAFINKSNPIDYSFGNITIKDADNRDMELAGKKYIVQYPGKTIEGIIYHKGTIFLLLPHSVRQYKLSIPGYIDEVTVTRGKFSPGIKGIQERLMNLAYLEEATGKLDLITCEAIAEFQADYEMQLTACEDIIAIEGQLIKASNGE